MTVYLDDWRQPARLGPVDDRWSHLLADTDEELHAFAARMGMKREWFQHRTHRPHQAHYDMPERSRGRGPGSRSRPGFVATGRAHDATAPKSCGPLPSGGGSSDDVGETKVGEW